jgi:hypothetical protein
VIAIVAFFSPCDFELPKRHLAATLASLGREGVPAILAQVVQTGQEPQPVPAGVRSLVYESDDVVFFKENLWNLAARSADDDKLLFLDADIRFSVDRFADAAASLLDFCDVCQPFEVAHWFDRDGLVCLQRGASAAAIARGVEPKPSEWHPGFAWAMTRTAFDRLGGFYELHPFGGGDTAFSYCLDERWVETSMPRMLKHDAAYWWTSSYAAYQRNAFGLNLRVGYLQGVHAYHLWHGETVNRRYVDRAKSMPLGRGDEYPLHHRPDGLLAWNDPSFSAVAREYFVGRREDG